ncbi:unnamed protein product [Wuchereria bancrofti]|uniref:Uncharacterized protein n=1 Tax=Wuchereria bancrofti TaxID=6293 RepID=A0A3P7DKN5_WUCBA|nr:unnamed protein product [Wuchereria bancrofti]
MEKIKEQFATGRRYQKMNHKMIKVLWSNRKLNCYNRLTVQGCLISEWSENGMFEVMQLLVGGGFNSI